MSLVRYINNYTRAFADYMYRRIYTEIKIYYHRFMASINNNHDYHIIIDVYKM